jgi:hypothetical protein
LDQVRQDLVIRVDNVVAASEGFRSCSILH